MTSDSLCSQIEVLRSGRRFYTTEGADIVSTAKEKLYAAARGFIQQKDIPGIGR